MWCKGPYKTRLYGYYESMTSLGHCESVTRGVKVFDLRFGRFKK